MYENAFKLAEHVNQTKLKFTSNQETATSMPQMLTI